MYVHLDDEISLIHPIKLNDLAEQIGDYGFTHAQLIDFVLSLDAQLADWDFTIALRDKLTEEIPQDVQDDHDHDQIDGVPVVELKTREVRAFLDFLNKA